MTSFTRLLYEAFNKLSYYSCGFSPQETKELTTIDQEQVNARYKFSRLDTESKTLPMTQVKKEKSTIQPGQTFWILSYHSLRVAQLDNYIPLLTQQQWKEETWENHDLAMLPQAPYLTNVFQDDWRLEERQKRLSASFFDITSWWLLALFRRWLKASVHFIPLVSEAAPSSF
jgi:hypothetical protein